jgi:signal transduction histidine kinase/ActR/RegA family two-component response regulator
MAAYGLFALREQQVDQAERVGLELSRSVANAVDAELRSAIAVLETLATAPSLDDGDLAAFRIRAERVLAARPTWAAIVLADLNGRVVTGTDASATTSAPMVSDDVEAVLNFGGPIVGPLLRTDAGDWVFHVSAPVARDGRTRHIVIAVVTPEAIRQVLIRQQLPPDWIISIVDGTNTRVARSRGHEENLGGRLSATAQQVVDAGGNAGFGISLTLEGERIFTSHARLTNGWAAVLGFPTALTDAAVTRAWLTYGGGVLLSILLGTAAAIWIARTITRPIGRLRLAAEAVGRRETPALPDTPIQEVRAVAAALRAAAADLAQSESDRERLLQNERQARTSAEAADRAKDEFMAVLSHELRTPLNAVYGWAKMLESGHVRGDAAITRATSAIVRNADVQVRLIDDLLDLSRITSGKLRLDITDTDPAAVAREAVDAVQPAADGKRIRIATTLPSAGTMIRVDPARLQQIIWNLLINAVKFTPEDGRITLSVEQTATQTSVVVTDTGQGIDADTLPHIFERFRQADSSSTRSHGGLGLGLALVKHLTELHGGTVAADSPGPGHGARFTVTLPVAGGSSPRVSAGSAAASRAVADAKLASLDGLRVLVVDDDREGLEMVDAILTRAGATVQTTVSASSGLDLIRTWKPDVLVSDIEMPSADGYVLIRQIRALGADEGGSIPAIALTAYGRPRDRGRAIDAGFTMHIPKPVDPGELTSIIAGIAERSPDTE